MGDKIPHTEDRNADLEDGLCASPLVQDAGVTSIYNEEQATELPIAYVVPFDKNVLEGGKAAEAFAHTLRQHIESKYIQYKWFVPCLLVFANRVF